MGKFSILICDPDEVYVKRLAAGLQRQLKEKAIINTTDHCSGESLSCEGEVHLLLSSEVPEFQWRMQHENCTFIWLDGGDEDGQKMTERIYKYQSVSQIGRELVKYMPAQRSRGKRLGVSSGQRWYGVVSPARHESMIPFSVALAQQLNEERQTLVLLFMEFSGVGSLLGLSQNTGMEEFLLGLRQQEKDHFEQVPLPEVHQLPGLDLLNVTDNPIILYELVEADVEKLIERIQCCGQYEAVVWVAGNMLQGIESLVQVSERVFSIEKGDSYSRCCQDEFSCFFEKLNVDQQVLCPVMLPVLQGIEPGQHLLLQWKLSPIGAIAKECLKGVKEHGSVDRDYAQSDPESVGCQF